MGQEVVISLSTVSEVGQDLHSKYVTQRLKNATIPITNNIPCKKISTFANQPDITKKRSKTNSTEKQNMTFITKLFMSLQSRPDADMKDLFCFENQRLPPSLADCGSLHLKKSDILECIKALTGRSGAAKLVTVLM